MIIYNGRMKVDARNKIKALMKTAFNLTDHNMNKHEQKHSLAHYMIAWNSSRKEI
jgi:hypothetical protein